MTWGKWLEKHLEGQADIINKSKMYDAEREKLLQSKAMRKSAVAPLIEIEKMVLDASETLSTKKGPVAIHAVELRKGLVKLKKAAKQANIGKGELITKEMFDQYLGDVIGKCGLLASYFSIILYTHTLTTTISSFISYTHRFV